MYHAADFPTNRPRAGPAPSAASVLDRLRSLAACVILVLAVAAPPGATGQQAPEIPPPGDALYEIELADGSEFIARITAVEGESVVFTTAGGARLEVQPSQIRAVRPAGGSVVGGQYWAPDRNDSRLFFTATGRTLPKGRAYVGTYLIVLPFVAVGITDGFTLAAGAPVLFGKFEPFYVAPKVQLVRTEKAQISVGTLAFFFEEEVVGIAYGVGTFGSSDNAFTAGLGFGYSGEDFESEPLGMIGGETRLGRRVKLMSENYFLPGSVDEGIVFSGGLRFISGNLSADVGIAGAAGNDAGCCLPLVNFSWAFGGGG